MFEAILRPSKYIAYSSLNNAEVITLRKTATIWHRSNEFPTPVALSRVEVGALEVLGGVGAVDPDARLLARPGQDEPPGARVVRPGEVIVQARRGNLDKKKKNINEGTPWAGATPSPMVILQNRPFFRAFLLMLTCLHAHMLTMGSRMAQVELNVRGCSV